MAKVHRAYRHSWYENRFQHRGLFHPVTITEHGSVFSNSVIRVNEEETRKLNTDQQIRWLREVMAKMEEAKAESFTLDWDAYKEKRYKSDSEWEQTNMDIHGRLAKLA